MTQGNIFSTSRHLTEVPHHKKTTENSLGLWRAKSKKPLTTESLLRDRCAITAQPTQLEA